MSEGSGDFFLEFFVSDIRKVTHHRKRDIKFCGDTQDNQSLGECPKQYFPFPYHMDLCRFLPTMTTHENYISLLQNAAR